MHPMSAAVAEMAANASAVARRSARAPIDPAELEHFTHHVLGELVRSRPRVTDYLPELALNQVLAFLGMRERSGGLRRAKGAAANKELAARAADLCGAPRQDCWQVSESSDGKPICRCSGRIPAASAWYARLPWRVSTASARRAQMPA